VAVVANVGHVAALCLYNTLVLFGNFTVRREVAPKDILVHSSARLAIPIRRASGCSGPASAAASRTAFIRAIKRNADLQGLSTAVPPTKVIATRSCCGLAILPAGRTWSPDGRQVLTIVVRGERVKKFGSVAAQQLGERDGDQSALRRPGRRASVSG
jgi:hypothetical protein